MSDVGPEIKLDKVDPFVCSVCDGDIRSCAHSEKNRVLQSGDFQTLLDAKLAQTYTILDFVGRGGFSIVFKARHKILNQVRAIKMLHSYIADTTALKRFRQEGQTLSELRHPNIVYVHDSGICEESGKPYLIMDFIEGQSLADVIKETGGLPVDRAINILCQSGDALSYAHEHGIVHRDIKPGNIMLEKNDVAKLVDFGIAKLTGDEKTSGALTQTGEVFGSPTYMSPEQCVGQRNVDARSDVYAFGCVMYEVLTGEPAFTGDTMLAIIHKQMTESPPPLRLKNCDTRTRQNLDAIIFKALEKEPAKRYQSMSDLVQDLRNLGSKSAGAASAYTGTARLLKRMQKETIGRPVRLLAVLIPLVCILWLGSEFLSLQAELTKPLKPFNTVIPSKWVPDRVVRPEPIDFKDKERKAVFLLDYLRDTRGKKGQEWAEKNERLGKWYMTYGRWKDAGDTLRESATILSGLYGRNESVADVAMTAADCYALNGDYDIAAIEYGRAISNYAVRKFGTYSGSEFSANLGLASMLTKSRNPDRLGDASTIYEKLLDKLSEGEHFDRARIYEGLGDVDIQLADQLPERTSAVLKDAVRRYTMALQDIEATSEGFAARNTAVILSKLAEAQAAQGNYKDAALLYDRLVRTLQKSGIVNAQDEKVAIANDAKLHWRTGDISGALRLALRSFR